MAVYNYTYFKRLLIGFITHNFTFEDRKDNFDPGSMYIYHGCRSNNPAEMLDIIWFKMISVVCFRLSTLAASTIEFTRGINTAIPVRVDSGLPRYADRQNCDPDF